MERIKKALKDQAGASMVSVVAAFAILMIVIAMLSTAIVTSMNLVAGARRQSREQAALVEEFYRDYQPVSAQCQELVLKEEHGEEISLSGNLEEKLVGEKNLHFYYYQYPAEP